MAKNAAQAAVKAAKNQQHEIPKTGRKKIAPLRAVEDAPSPSAIADSPPPILAVEFETDRFLNMGVTDKGELIGVLQRIDVRDRKLSGGRVTPSKHVGFFAMQIRGPLLVVSYRGPKGRALVAVPIVGCVRKLTFDPS